MTQAPDQPARVPCGAKEIAAAAAAIGLAIPEACLPGVVANLALLTRHAGIFRSEPQGGGG